MDTTPSPLSETLAPPLTHLPGKKPFRSLELDGLRGIAVALVVLFHAPSDVLNGMVHSQLSAHVLKIWTIIHDSGWLGVDIFFSLSGFLITRNLLETKDKPHYYRNFYVRRVLRIMPLYLLILALVLAIYPHSIRYVLLSLVYFANFANALGQPVAYPVLWSLSVEEHFYLIWPTLVKVFSRRWTFLAGAAVCLATPILRALAASHGGFDPLYSWFRFDGFMYGAIVAMIFMSKLPAKRNLLRWSYVNLALTLGILVCGVPFRVYTRTSLLGETVLYSCVASLTSAVIAYAIANPGSRLLSILRNPILRLLGDISFWVYLIHDVLLRVMKPYLARLQQSNPYVWHHYPVSIYLSEFLYLGIVCFATGILVRKYIELPILKLKRYF